MRMMRPPPRHLDVERGMGRLGGGGSAEAENKNESVQLHTNIGAGRLKV